MTDETSRRGAEARGGVPTLTDVADAVGVSTATVSRALNSPDRVQPETRAKVLKAVEELGYAPNFNARALAAKRTNTVGAIVPTIDNAIFAKGMQAFQEELDRHDMTLLVASSSYKADLEAKQINTLVARGADALLLIGYERDPAIFDMLRRRDVPVLVTWSFDPAHEAAVVGFDNRAAMAELGRKVISEGHRRLGMISAEIAGNDRATERLEGVRVAMSNTGLDPEDLVTEITTYGIDTGDSAFERLISKAPETTAVLCGNDVLAIGALRAARRLGLKVPQNISITGYDDIEMASLSHPALTTIHVPHAEMSRLAAKTIVAMLRREEVDARVCLPTHLELRETLGPVPTAR